MLNHIGLLLHSIHSIPEDLQNHRLEKTPKIMQSYCITNTAMPAKPYPKVPHLHVF